jgi:hypothetical protein
MSIEDPAAFGIDVHPEYQWELNLAQTREQGYDFAFLKISEGPYRDGSVLPLRSLKEFYRRLVDNDFKIGLYAFLVESHENNARRTGVENAEHFLRRADSLGGLNDRFVIADFEAYNAPHAFLSPTNGNLEAFGERIRQEIPSRHPYLIYSTPSYWNGGQPSGKIEQYGTTLAWDAQLAANKVVDHPKRYYQTIDQWGWHDSPWGGVLPIFWQFTWAGRVANLNLDVDACRLSPEDYRDLWQSAA